MLSEAQQERLARNEAFFREVNERVRDAGTYEGADEDVYEFFCECAQADCLERVRLPLAAYEAVRAEPRRFIIAPGHDVPAIEHVVSEGAQAAIVEKNGTAGKVAEALDSRR